MRWRRAVGLDGFGETGVLVAASAASVCTASRVSMARGAMRAAVCGEVEQARQYAGAVRRLRDA